MNPHHHLSHAFLFEKLLPSLQALPPCEQGSRTTTITLTGQPPRRIAQPPRHRAPPREPPLCVRVENAIAPPCRHRTARATAPCAPPRRTTSTAAVMGGDEKTKDDNGEGL
ncbi:hypothetical protein ACSQ67_000993 [Phaseolus vulgaris]